MTKRMRTALRRQAPCLRMSTSRETRRPAGWLLPIRLSFPRLAWPGCVFTPYFVTTDTFAAVSQWGE